MVDAFDPEPWYKAERDGPLEKYLQIHGNASPPLFKGCDLWERLKEIGAIEPGAGVRVMYSMGFDESYIVTIDFKLRGIQCVFAGKPGDHDPRKILTKKGAPWILER